MSFEANKIAGAILAAMILAMVSGIVANILVRPTPLTNTLKAGLVQTMNRRPDEEVQVAMDASVLRDCLAEREGSPTPPFPSRAKRRRRILLRPGKP